MTFFEDGRVIRPEFATANRTKALLGELARGRWPGSSSRDAVRLGERDEAPGLLQVPVPPHLWPSY